MNVRDGTQSKGQIEKVLSPQSLAPVALHTANYQPRVNCYKTFLDAHTAFLPPRAASLPYDDQHHRVGTTAFDNIEKPKHPAPSIEHTTLTSANLNFSILRVTYRFSIRVAGYLHTLADSAIALDYATGLRSDIPTLNDLATAYEQRKACGTRPTWCLNDRPTTRMFHSDPDGNRLETWVENFEAIKEANSVLEVAGCYG